MKIENFAEAQDLFKKLNSLIKTRKVLDETGLTITLKSGHSIEGSITSISIESKNNMELCGNFNIELIKKALDFGIEQAKKEIEKL